MDYGIGVRIKEARLKKGITLKELGEAIGISESNMQKHEAGNIKGLNTERLQKIANALEVRATWIMGWELEQQERVYIEVTELTKDEIKKMEDYMAFLIHKRAVDYQAYLEEQRKKEYKKQKKEKGSESNVQTTQS